MAGVGKLLKQAQKMQRGIADAQQRLADERLEVSHGGGAVRITVNGHGLVLALNLDPEFLKEDKAVVEQALVAALLLRETLETPGRTAALVTPEASLARRTAAILERWGIDIAPSAGVPLSRTAPGSLLLILSRWIAKPADPVLLLAVLKHECVLLGRDPDAYRAIVSAMER